MRATICLYRFVDGIGEPIHVDFETIHEAETYACKLIGAFPEERYLIRSALAWLH